LVVSFGGHQKDFFVSAVKFGLDGIVAFLDGLFGLFDGVGDDFRLLECFGYRVIAFHEGQIGTFGEFQFTRICSHIIRALTVHELYL
jgi:hypothetical protein